MPTSAKQTAMDSVRIVEVHHVPGEVRAVVKQKAEMILVGRRVEQI